MAKYNREQRRKAKKAYGLKTDEQVDAFLTVLENESRVKAEKIKAEKILEEATPQLKATIRAEVSGEFITLLAAFLRDKWGWGKKRIRRTIEQFWVFAADMAANPTSAKLLAEFVKDETGYDIVEHLSEIR